MAENDYDKLSERLTDPETQLPEPQDVRSGAAAAAAGRKFLLEEYGSADAIKRAMRPGRPRLGASAQGPSPAVRGRLPIDDHRAFRALIERSGKTESELVREAVHARLVDEGLLSDR